MVAPLRNTTISIPGFLGLNTTDSEVTLAEGYARVAENCIIEEGGRLGARLGWQYIAQTATPETPIDLLGMHRFIDITGAEYFGAWSEDTFYIKSGSSLSAVTYNGSNTLTTGNWQAATLNDAAYLFQSGYKPIYFNPTSGQLDDVENATHSATVTITHSGTVATVTHVGHSVLDGDTVVISGANETEYNGSFTVTYIDEDSYSYTMASSPGSDATGTITAEWYKGTPPEANTVLSAYGRLWVADTPSNKTTVYWSNLLDGAEWRDNVGTVGSLDISGILINGNDEIVALGAHNGYLIIFCTNNIIIMGDSDADKRYLTPANLQLVEVINGIGCVARDSVVNTGTDILFLSESGVRSLGRTIQEKSQPVRDISRNVRDVLVDQVKRANTSNIKAIYSDHFAFYLLAVPDEGVVWCFDQRSPLQNGANRVTRWSGLDHTSWLGFDGAVYMTNTQGIAEYKGRQDNGESYVMQYYTNYFDFQMPNVVKIAKNLAATVRSSVNQKFFVKIGTDYEGQYSSYTLTVNPGNVYEYNDGLYGLTTTVVAGSQAADTVTNELGAHYTVDFSTTYDADTYNVELDVWLDADTYYYTTDNGSRTRTTLYTKAVDYAAEYSGGGLVDNVRIPVGGSGFVIQLGFESIINGGFLSLQQVDLFVKQGRLR